MKYNRRYYLPFISMFAVVLTDGISHAQFVQFEQIYSEKTELRYDKLEYASDWMLASPVASAGGSIARARAVAVTWSINISFAGDLFDELNATVGGSYQRTYTDTDTYTENIPTGAEARFVYVPMMHVVTGSAKIRDVVVYPAGGDAAPAVQYVDTHQDFESFLPVSGGRYQLQYRCRDLTTLTFQLEDCAGRGGGAARAEKPGVEIVYLSNCALSNGQKSSEMNYYSNSQLSQNGEPPKATAQVAQNETTTWEGYTVRGTFPDGNHFTSNITDHNGPVFSVKGSGFNDYHSFTCYQDTFRTLYRDGDKVCNSVHYCQP